MLTCCEYILIISKFIIPSLIIYQIQAYEVSSSCSFVTTWKWEIHPICENTRIELRNIFKKLTNLYKIKIFQNIYSLISGHNHHFWSHTYFINFYSIRNFFHITSIPFNLIIDKFVNKTYTIPFSSSTIQNLVISSPCMGIFLCKSYLIYIC